MRLALPGTVAVLVIAALVVQAQPASGPQVPLRALIISGGPTLDHNEYAIESNARYVESLTANARWKRVHFADGKRASRTISTVQTAANSREAEVLDWLLDRHTDTPEQAVRKPSTLRQLDGPSTKSGVQQGLVAFVRGAKPGEHGLLYFTGHGSTGMGKNWFRHPVEDTKNTTYALWNNGDISMRELASALQKPSGGAGWPVNVPLVLIMVQCHAGGFANVMYENGVTGGPLWNRDFAGFFAAPGDRMSSGCTSEMDERNYQDFTTHFFAALSGRTRDGQTLTGADYDGNGGVSLNEAFAYANIHDRSIDVPVSTSGEYLRVWGEQGAWAVQGKAPTTAYSQLMADAVPWQRALLTGLSRELGLKGEAREAAASSAIARLARGSKGGTEGENGTLWTGDVSLRYDRLHTALLKRFPRLRAAENSGRPIARRDRERAVRWLRSRPADVNVLDQALQRYYNANDGPEVREAMLLRFVRAAQTIALQKRLQSSGTTEQKAAFARLRRAENHNPLR